MDSNLDDKLARQRAFWSKENHDRPVIGFTGTCFSSDTIHTIKRAQGRVTPDDVDVESFLAYCDAQFEAWRDCTGDLL
jgi:hypothetical protein